MTDDSGPAPDQLEAWVEQVDLALTQLQVRLEPLLAEQVRLQERRGLLKELIASFGDEGAHSESRIGRPSAAESTRERVHRQAVEILVEAGRALHSNDLHAEFLRRGYEIPGAGKPNNITVHLTSWQDITSPERGMYGLTDQVGQQMNTSTTKRRTRKAR